MSDEPIRQVQVRLPPDLHRAAKVSAARDDLTLQAWVTDAIRLKLQREEGDASNGR